MKSFFSIAASLLLLVLYSGCGEDKITDPDVGSGDLLVSSLWVDNWFDEPGYYHEELTFSLDPDETFYDSATKRGEIVGVTTGDTLRTLTLRFEHDIEKGKFPVTYSGTPPSGQVKDQHAFYMEVIEGRERWYICDLDSCRITLTASNGSIVAGEFAAYMVGTDDGGAILQGNFSVRFRE